MTKTRKALRTIVVLGLVGALAAVGAFSAFSSTTENPGNVVSTGTVSLADNDLGAALYSIADGKPGSSDEHCIKVSYTGSLPSTVRIYRPAADALGPLAQHVNVVVQPGSGDQFDCGDFAADGAAAFSNTLDNLPTSYAGGIQDGPGAGLGWTTGQSVTYRVTATIDANAPDSAQGQSTGSHRLVWEAQNQ